MKGLSTLIKLSTRTLDELRREMVSLENQKTELLQLIEKMKADLAQEIKLAATTADMGRFFGDFSKRMRDRQEEILLEIKALDKKMEILREGIALAFADVKRYEIALENAKKRAQEQATRRETNDLDEIAGQQYVRKQKTEP